MPRRANRIVSAVCGALAAGCWPGALLADDSTDIAGMPVDVELVLAVDTSSSMTRDELVLQRQGYTAAFRSRDVIEAIRYGLHGRIAVTYVEWGASNSRNVVLPWTLVAGASDAHRVADLLEEAKVRNLFQTSISGAIRHGARALAKNAYRGERRVIDISGDGPNNDGGLVTLSRDAALAEGITINGLPLMLADRHFGDETLPTLDDYYADCVIGGPRSFIVPVRSWDQFPEAVRRKLVLELSGGRPLILRISGSTHDALPGSTDCLVGEQIWSGMERG